ncbi:unnamed protein product [Prorocentrum cordatum]|uniref:Transmembrane 9 superfamily member n=1 Tax=Prorocentrum cordatum TaxID=2364126 RepID=A0ABN9T6N6_9DINO|nr:unnamed protein product [Polarella glacialis]
MSWSARAVACTGPTWHLPRSGSRRALGSCASSATRASRPSGSEPGRACSCSTPSSTSSAAWTCASQPTSSWPTGPAGACGERSRCGPGRRRGGRGVAMLAALGFFLHFTLRWTHAALGLRAPRALLGQLRLLLPALALGMSGCALMLLASNRIAWIFGLLVLVVCLNAASCFASWVILDRLSEIRRAPRSPSADPKLEALERVVMLESAATCRTMLALAVVVLGIFIPVSLPRLLEGGLRWPLVRGFAQGTWVGDTRFPALAALASEAPDVLPNPCVEGAELAIGWGICGCLLLSRLCAGRVEAPAETGGGRLSAEELGAALRGMLARKAE